MNAIEMSGSNERWKNGATMEELVQLSTTLKEMIERLEKLAEDSNGENQLRFRIMAGEAWSLFDEMNALIRKLQSKQMIS